MRKRKASLSISGLITGFFFSLYQKIPQQKKGLIFILFDLRTLTPEACCLDELCFTQSRGLNSPWNVISLLDFEFSSWDVQINSSSFATGREHASIIRVCGSWTPNFWEVTVHIQHLQLAQENKRESSLLLSELQRCLAFSVWPSKGSVEFDPVLCSSFHPFLHTCQVCDYHCTLLSRIILKWLCEPMGWKLRSIPPLILKNPFHLVDFFNSALPGFFFKDFFPSPSVNYAGYSELQTCAETLER